MPGNGQKYLLHVLRDRCDGCMKCVYACARVKGIQDVPETALLRVTGTDGCWDVIVCRHCSPAPCVDVCEFNALRVDEGTGAVILRRDLCTTCKACMAVCPFEAVFEGPGGATLKCDLCGGDPECVKVCDRGALIYEPVNSRSIRSLKTAVRELELIKGLRG